MLKSYVGGANIFLTSDSGKLDIHMETHAPRSQSLTLKSKYIKDFKEIPGTPKLLEENIGKTFQARSTVTIFSNSRRCYAGHSEEEESVHDLTHPGPCML